MLLNPLSAFSSVIQHVAQLRAGRKNLVISSIGRTLTINGKKFLNPNWRYKGPGKLVRPPKTNIVIPFGKAISGAVLANNLGLRPLLMDLEAFLKQVPNSHEKERRTHRATASDVSSSSQSTAKTVSTVKFTYTDTTTVTTTVRATCLVEDKFNVLEDLGMSVYDIPGAAWELIPYSFLVDYLVNIGALLDAGRARLTQKFLAECLVTTVETVTTRTMSGFSLPSPWVLDYPAVGSATLTTIWKHRELGLNAGFAYRPVSQILKPSRIQNILSLIVQNLAGLNPGRKRTPFF